MYSCVLKTEHEVLCLCLCAFLCEMSLFSHLAKTADNKIIATVKSSLNKGGIFMLSII